MLSEVGGHHLPSAKVPSSISSLESIHPNTHDTITSQHARTMAPYTNIPLSPAELSYLHTSLSQQPPIRPDGRASTQFRPLIAETDILPTANGSARICFADGTEAIVGVKAEVEKSQVLLGAGGEVSAEGVLGLGNASSRDVDMEVTNDNGGAGRGKGKDEWLEVTIEIPGMRDDDALPVFLAAMLTEALLAGVELQDRLWINNRFHWRLYIDVSFLAYWSPNQDHQHGKLTTCTRFFSSHNLSHIPSHSFP